MLDLSQFLTPTSTPYPHLQSPSYNLEETEAQEGKGLTQSQKDRQF